MWQRTLGCLGHGREGGCLSGTTPYSALELGPAMEKKFRVNQLRMSSYKWNRGYNRREILHVRFLYPTAGYPGKNEYFAPQYEKYRASK